MAETPEIPAAPAGIPPLEPEASPPEAPAAPTAEGAADGGGQAGWAASVSPAAVGSYPTPPAAETVSAVDAPTLEAEAAVVEQPDVASADGAAAAPAVFVATYGAPGFEAPSSGAGEPPAVVATLDAAPPAPLGTGETAIAAPDAAGPEPAIQEPSVRLEAAPEIPPASAETQASLSAAPAVEPPGIASSLVVPPLAAGEAGEGGEWDLLVGKVQAWFDGADVRNRWESLGGPLRASGLLLGAVVVLRLYSALLETLGDLPLVPRLLQLAGLITVVRFCLTRLVRSSERERILGLWRERWNDFRGRD